jgi:hypothetical protein
MVNGDWWKLKEERPRLASLTFHFSLLAFHPLLRVHSRLVTVLASALLPVINKRPARKPVLRNCNGKGRRLKIELIHVVFSAIGPAAPVNYFAG